MSRYEGKLSSTVLRGGRAGNSPLPLGTPRTPRTARTAAVKEASSPSRKRLENWDRRANRCPNNRRQGRGVGEPLKKRSAARTSTNEKVRLSGKPTFGMRHASQAGWVNGVNESEDAQAARNRFRVICAPDSIAAMQCFLQKRTYDFLRPDSQKIPHTATIG